MVELDRGLYFGLWYNSPACGPTETTEEVVDAEPSTAGATEMTVVVCTLTMDSTGLLFARVTGRVTGILEGSGGGGGLPTALAESSQAVTHPL